MRRCRDMGHTVTHAHPSLQTSHRGRVKDVPDHAVRLDLVEATARAAGHDTRSILSTVISALSSSSFEGTARIDSMVVCYQREKLTRRTGAAARTDPQR
jgi:hypothetical protein